MEIFLETLGLMTCIYGILEVLTILCKRLDDQFDPKKSSNLAFVILFKIMALVVYICMICSAPIGILVSLHDRRMEEIHRELFLEDRKPYEEVLQSQIATLSAENKRLEGVIEFYKDNHRKEIARISEERRESGYRSGYASGFKNGFDYCLDRTEYSGNDESELRLDARAVANYEAKKWLQEQMSQENL